MIKWILIEIFLLVGSIGFVLAQEANNLHWQTTVVPQWNPPFTSPYSGKNSLPSDTDIKMSLTSTAYWGLRSWQGGEFYLNPELAAGSGLGSTLGIAGFSNGEIYRVDSPDPKLSISRIYIKQIFNLGGNHENKESGKNQLESEYDVNRFTVVVGKFSLNDFFDDNTFSHDPRTQFLNWALMDNGAWDYAADTRGYTWGFYFEYNQSKWTLRFASVLEPKSANQMEYDLNVASAHGDNLEWEYRYVVNDQPGKLRLISFVNHAFMGSYQDTINTLQYGMDIKMSRQYSIKYGLGINFEQRINSDIGLFSRLGWNNGTTESWAFTEIDRSFSLGMSSTGAQWSRPLDTVGVATIVNGLSSEHSSYLKLGGNGFIIGDGTINYGAEQIFEAYYSLVPFSFCAAITLDYQFINHPGYNIDRGPVNIYGMRVHAEM